MKTRVAASVLGTLAGLLALELVLRVAHRSLPSVAGLDGTGFELQDLVVPEVGGDADLCPPAKSFLAHRGRPTTLTASGRPTPPPRPPADPEAPLAPREWTAGTGAASRALWLVGDSVTYGLGVEASETFGALLADRLADALGVSVSSHNLGIPAADYCIALRRLEAELSVSSPDLVLVTLFADDLQGRHVLLVGDRVVAPPDAARGSLTRWLVHRSYVANLVWFHTAALSPREGSGSAVDDLGRAVTAMRDRVEAAGGTPMFAILPAPGEASCDRSPTSPCGWLAADVDRMAAELRRVGLSFVDLRGAWPKGTDHIRAEELPSIAEGGVPIHPNAVGHRILAEALWRGLFEKGVPQRRTRVGAR